jgi:hypothetical protein
MHMGNVPISKVCPQCGSKEYTSRKAQALVAFADDRVCMVCHTRYSPTTPAWAAVVFLLCALALPILGFILIGLLFDPFSCLGLVCEGAFCLVALVVFISGVRMLIST